MDLSERRPLYPLRAPGTHFDTIGPAWDIVKKDLSTWIPAILMFALVGYGSQFLMALPLFALEFAPIESDDVYFIVYTLAQTVLMILPMAILMALSGSITMLGIRQINGERTEIADMLIGFQRFRELLAFCAAYSGVSLLISIPGLSIYYWTPVDEAGRLLFAPAQIGMLAVLALIGLGVMLWLYGVLMFAGPHIVVSGLPWLDALKESFRATHRHGPSLFVLVLVLSLMWVLSACFCLVPALFTAPVVALVVAAHYRYFFPAYSVLPPRDYGRR